MQIETGLLERSGQALSNFSEALPSPQSDLARVAVDALFRAIFDSPARRSDISTNLFIY